MNQKAKNENIQIAPSLIWLISTHIMRMLGGRMTLQAHILCYKNAKFSIQTIIPTELQLINERNYFHEIKKKHKNFSF